MNLYKSLNILCQIVLSVAVVSGCNGESTPLAKTPANHSEHDAHASTRDVEHETQFIFSTIPERPRAGESVELEIMLHDAAGQMLKEFEPIHEKLAHLILVREGLDEFAHLHPVVDKSGTMTTSHTFLNSGRYLVFLDYKPFGKPAATGQAKFVVAGDSSPAPILRANVPGTVTGDGLHAKVVLSTSKESAQVVAFEVQDESGMTVNDLQPYLGAMGHLVILSADGEQYVHSHPLTETATGGKVEFEVHFPGPGTFKGWGQFQRQNKVFTIPAVMQIEGIASHH